ncbi:60Kd inner membrane protein-domain-containing protein [Phellopilus nigrolimitatus]|nr:60Kd inner membrane protein-domain-containing protein [Phellopilus nigrolimitatus]
MNASLSSCLARSARCGSSRNAVHVSLLPARSLTRLQRSRPIVQTGQLSWTLGAARSFSWNPWGGVSKPQSPTPKNETLISEAPVSPQAELAQESVSAAAGSPSQAGPAADASAPLQIDTVPLTDNGAVESLSNAVSDSLSNVASAVSTIPPPMQYGDMAALDLVHWTPAGFFPWLLEVTHVSTGLPWWGVIMLTTAGVRMALLPIVVRGQRTAMRLAPFQPQLREISEKVKKAHAENDQMLAQQAKVQRDAVMAKTGVNPLEQMLAAVFQVCVQIGFFLGLRNMCSAPVEQLKFGGFGFLTDLTVPDPYYITPLLNTALINVQLWLSQRDTIAIGSAATPHIMNGLRAFTLFGLPFMIFFPAGLNIHLISSISFIALQTLMLRIPAVRTRFGLGPPLPVPKNVPTMRDSAVFVKDWYNVRVIEAQAKEADRARKMRMVTKTPTRR